MKLSLLPLTLGLSLGLLTACLPDDPPVKGRLLVSGTNIENSQFVIIDDVPWVLYSERRDRPRARKGGVADLQLVNYVDGTRRTLLAGRAERAEWPPDPDASGLLFLVTDERLGARGLPVGTLNRVSLAEGIKESIPDVMSYVRGPGGNTFYYRKYVEGQALAELHLRDLAGRDRNLGPTNGPIAMLGNDTVYHVGGADLTLLRTQGFDGATVPLRTRVSTFTLGDNGRFAIATVLDEGKPRTMVLDFEKGTERPLPVENPCCALGLRGPIFMFADIARPPRPAELHHFNVDTGEDQVVQLPPELQNVTGMIPRPRSNELLIFDSVRRFAVYRPTADPATSPLPRFEVIAIRPQQPEFTEDGKYLLYLLQDPPPPPPAVDSFPTGRLFVQSAEDWIQPPRQLSPEGASVSIESKGYRLRGARPYPLMFWARFGLGSADLYLADHETGVTVRVAQSIGRIHVTQTQLIGVLNLTQDLTGSLVVRNLADNKEVVIEHGVFDVEIFDQNVAFTVHERNPASPRNGLWATMLPSIDAP